MATTDEGQKPENKTDAKTAIEEKKKEPFGGILSDFSTFGKLWDRFNKRFDALFRTPFDELGSFDLGFREPMTKMTTKDDAYVYHVEVPGLTSTDLDIEVEGKFLTVKGEKNLEEHDDDYYRKDYHKYYQRVMLPHDAEYKGDIEAKVEDGVLDITVKRKKKETRKVDVK
jgi:HSP20 family protein